MAVFKIDQVYPIFVDTNGNPINNGKLYVGVAGQNAETNPISVYSNIELTIPVPNPLTINNGYIYSSGTPVNIFTATDYSITVKNAQNEIVFVKLSSLNATSNLELDTLYDLRNISYPANTVWVSGYHTKNDGVFGSHIFRLKGIKTTETDNGGTVIIATIGGVDYVYELQYDGTVNVKWFGAVGDGVADDRLFIINWLEYLFESSQNGVGTPDNYLISSPISITNDNAMSLTIDFKGMNFTVPNNYDTTQGTLLLLNRANYSANSSITIKNLKIDGSNITPIESTTSTTYTVGGFRIYKFGIVQIENIHFKGFFFSRGIWCSYFNKLNLNNYIAENVGGKFNWTVDSTSPYDSSGDAIYLSNAIGNATANLSNITANGQVLGRAGIVSESIDAGNFLNINIRNASFDNYNRIIHVEDNGLSSVSWDSGNIKNFSIFSFIYVNLTNLSPNIFKFRNLQIDFTKLVNYGGSSGLWYNLSAANIIFDTCDITYNSNSLELGKATINNSKIKISDSILVTPRSGFIINSSELILGVSSSLYNNSSVLTNSEFNRVNISQALLYEPALKFNLVKMKFNECNFTNVTPSFINGSGQVSKYIGCYFEMNNAGAITRLFFGSNAYKHFYDCEINNTTTNDLYVYSDGGAKVLKCSNLKTIDTKLSLYSTNVSECLIDNLEQLFTGNTTATTAITTYNTEVIINGYLLRDPTDKITPPARSSTFILNNSYEIGSAGTITTI